MKEKKRDKQNNKKRKRERQRDRLNPPQKKTQESGVF